MYYSAASTTSNQAYIGMPIQEFKDIAGKQATLAAMESGYTVFKMKDYGAWSGAVIDTRFFYFDSLGKLYKIDGGQFKQNRYQIEVIKN